MWCFIKFRKQRNPYTVHWEVELNLPKRHNRFKWSTELI